MAQGPRGVPAPPNEVEIIAKVLSATRSPDMPDRWVLEIEVRQSRSIEGPNFAHVGKTFRAFAHAPVADLSGLLEIRAKAEYVGDERGGAFHLKDVTLRR